METYKIIRGYFRNDVPDELIEVGLTLEEAQQHCKDPETSSRTATSDEAMARTAQYGPWFERYTGE